VFGTQFSKEAAKRLYQQMQEAGLDADTVEYKGRRDEESKNIPIDQVIDFLKSSNT